MGETLAEKGEKVEKSASGLKDIEVGKKWLCTLSERTKRKAVDEEERRRKRKVRERGVLCVEEDWSTHC